MGKGNKPRLNINKKEDGPSPEGLIILASRSRCYSPRKDGYLRNLFYFPARIFDSDMLTNIGCFC